MTPVRSRRAERRVVLLKIPRGDTAELEKTVADACVCVLLKRKKAESEAQRGKPKGTLESESRNAIVQ